MQNKHNTKNIYEIIIGHEKNAQLIYSTDGFNWISIFEENSGKVALGICETGSWVLKNNDKLHIMENKKTYLYSAILLEVPFENIKARVEIRLKNIMREEKLCLLEVFPFYQIVDSALNQLIDDYWFNLAMQWYDNFDIEMQFKLKDSLESIVNTKKISQKNRQRARREIKKIKEFEHKNSLSIC